MLQCRFCLAEVDDADGDGIVECECGARFPVGESLFVPGGAGPDLWDAEEDGDDPDDLGDVDLEF